MKERKNINPDNTADPSRMTGKDWESASSWFNEKRNAADMPFSERRIVDESGEIEFRRKNNTGYAIDRGESTVVRKETSGEARTAKEGEKERKLTKKQKAYRKKLNAYYRKNKSSGKSKDDLRKEFAEKARKKRRRKIIEFVIATVVLFIGALIVLSTTVLFKITQINVTGETRYSAQQIIDASDVKQGDNLWRTTDEKVTKKATSALPYVKSVKVKRSMPDKIILEVEETSAAYAVKNGKKFILIDESGKVLETKAKKYSSAALIVGIKADNAEACAYFKPDDEEKYAAALDIAEGAREKGLKLSRIDVEDVNMLQAVCEKRVLLDFGAGTDMSKKLAMAAEVIEKLKESGSLPQGVINLKSVTKVFFKEQEIK